MIPSKTVTYGTGGDLALQWEAPNPKAGILFFHGHGERKSEGIRLGSGIDLIRKHGIPKLLTAGIDLPYAVYAPQCPGTTWDDRELILSVLKEFDALCKKHGITERHVTGLSMGGRGTYSSCGYAYEFNGNKPGYFKTYGVVCGWGDNPIPNPIRFTGTKWKLWHGTNDTTSPATYTNGIKLYENLTKMNIIPVEFVALQGVGHDAWTHAYNMKDPDNYFRFIEGLSDAQLIADLMAKNQAAQTKLQSAL